MKGFLRLRGNTYYFRCRVPSDILSTYFTGNEILKSLHTSDKKIHGYELQDIEYALLIHPTCP